MRFSYPDISGFFKIDTENVNSIVIENRALFRELVSDVYSQIDGLDGKAVLENDSKLLSFSKYAEIFTGFVPFEINRKNLITKITARIEKESVNPFAYENTMKLLSQTELWLDSLSENLDCNLTYTKLSAGSLIKAAGIEIIDDYSSLAEKIIDYMELVREFDRDKLFFTVNLRSFIDDDEAEKFIETALTHDFKLVMLENKEYKRIKGELRRTIDEDLCEF